MGWKRVLLTKPKAVTSDSFLGPLSQNKNGVALEGASAFIHGLLALVSVLPYVTLNGVIYEKQVQEVQAFTDRLQQRNKVCVKAYRSPKQERCLGQHPI